MSDNGTSDQDWQRWRDLAAGELRGADPDDLVRTLPEGIEVKPIYTGADLAGIEDLEALPGNQANRPSRH